MLLYNKTMDHNNLFAQMIYGLIFLWEDSLPTEQAV